MANVRDFQYIAEIARYGSITKAAEALYLSQPTLTKFLQRVEQEAQEHAQKVSGFATALKKDRRRGKES